MVFGKINSKSDEYDNLLFVRRDIQNLIIPSFIKRIGRYAFPESNIEQIFIPQHVTEICEGSFLKCTQLKHIEISNQSELRIIEPFSFLGIPPLKINIPSNVTVITVQKFMKEEGRLSFKPQKWMAKSFFLNCFTKETNDITVLDIVNEFEAHKDKLGNINEDVQKYENKSNTFLLEYSNEIKKRSEESSFYSEIYNRLLCVTEKKKQEKYLDSHEDME